MTRRAAVWRSAMRHATVWRQDHGWSVFLSQDSLPFDLAHFPTHAEALAYAIHAVGLAPHPEDCDCNHCCTHEITSYGRCAGCGAEV